MRLTLKLTADREHVQMNVPQLEFSPRFANRAAYHVPAGGGASRLLDVGHSPDELRKRDPQWWQQNGRQVNFIAPFSKPGVEGGFARLAMEFYLDQARRQARPNAASRALLGWNDRLDVELHIPGYDETALGKRRDFEFHLLDQPDAGRLLINRLPSEWTAAQQRSAGLLLNLATAAVGIPGYIILFLLAQRWTASAGAVTLLETLRDLAVVLAAGAVIFVGVLALGSLLWVGLARLGWLGLKVPPALLRRTLARRRMPAPLLERLLRWLPL